MLRGSPKNKRSSDTENIFFQLVVPHCSIIEKRCHYCPVYFAPCCRNLQHVWYTRDNTCDHALQWNHELHENENVSRTHFRTKTHFDRGKGQLEKWPTSSQWRLAEKYHKKGLMPLSFDKTAFLSLGCKLVPVQYRGYKNGLFAMQQCFATWMTTFA